MRHERHLAFAVFVIGATVVAGCSSSPSSSPDAGTGGSTGAGGATPAGTGGSTADGAVDHAADVADTGADTAADTGGADVPATDAGVRDAGNDTGSGPCTTSYGAANPVQFAFNGGVNGGWTQFATSDTVDGGGLTTSLGASFTDGKSCPGALLLAVNFTAYGSPLRHGQSAATEYYYGTGASARNWSAYKALHAFIKVQTADPLGLDRVYFYTKSGNQAFYQSDNATSAQLTDWHEVVIDLTHPPASGAGVMANDIQQIGFEVVLNMAPPPGAPATPSQVILFADDIWLEAFPPADGGSGDGAAADGSGQ